MKTKPKLVTIQYRRRGDHSKGNTWKDHATVRPRVGRGFIAFHERNECAREWRIKPDLMVQYRVRHAYLRPRISWLSMSAKRATTNTASNQGREHRNELQKY